MATNVYIARLIPSNRETAEADLLDYITAVMKMTSTKPLSDKKKKTIVDKCTEPLAWVNSNQSAEKVEVEYQQKELEKVCNPIITKLYQKLGINPIGKPCAPCSHVNCDLWTHVPGRHWFIVEDCPLGWRNE